MQEAVNVQTVIPASALAVIKLFLPVFVIGFFPCSDGCFGDPDHGAINLWALISDKGRQRAGHSAVFHNQTMWVYGGYNFSHALSSLDMFSLTEKQWLSCETSNQPVARYLHSAVLFNGSSMLVYGGLSSRHMVMDDFWSFNFTTRLWRKLENNIVPALAAHTVTQVGDYVFLVGGYMKNGSLSSTMYIWSAIATQWSVECPKNGEDKSVRMAGHSTVYYAPLESLVIFGGIRGTTAGGQLLYMYHVREKIWTAVGQQFPSNTLSPYSQLAFHTATVVGSYMVITGGYDTGSARACSESTVYFYHLDCQVFLGASVVAEKNLCKFKCFVVWLW